VLAVTVSESKSDITTGHEDPKGKVEVWLYSSLITVLEAPAALPPGNNTGTD
jgi:hypothetical protein